jgi:hypothetical protein
MSKSTNGGRKAGLKNFKPLMNQTAEALGSNLLDKDASKSRAAFDAEIEPRLGCLLLEIHDLRKWLLCLAEMPPKDRPRLPWIDEDDPSAAIDPVEFLSGEINFHLGAFERASRVACILGDLAFFEQVSHCLVSLSDPEGTTSENLKWLACYGMALLVNKRAAPPAGEVADWFNGGSKSRTVEARDATGAFNKAALKSSPLAPGRRGVRKSRENPD